jgi:surface antigen
MLILLYQLPVGTPKLLKINGMEPRSVMKKKIAAVALAALVLAGCQPGAGPKETGGGIIGAIGGAAVGSQFGRGTGNVAAIAAGTLLGAWLGSEIGRSLDARDRALIEQAQTRAYGAPVGQRITWNNPQSGNSGHIVTTREGTMQGGTYCREFQNTIIVGGRSEQAYGTACRQPDGSWRIVN